MRPNEGGEMHPGADQWLPVLADRGTVLALVFLSITLAGILAAGLGGITLRPRV